MSVWIIDKDVKAEEHMNDRERLKLRSMWMKDS